jgi:hypothetical protein
MAFQRELTRRGKLFYWTLVQYPLPRLGLLNYQSPRRYLTALTLEARNSYQEIPEIGIIIFLEERKWECGLSDGVTTHS